MLKPSELPAPDTLIDYGGGTFGPLMFHFASEADSPSQIARDQGFEHYWVEMCDVLSDDDPVSVAHSEGAPSEEVLPLWTPPPPKAGFFLAGKNDTENGPVAHYLRKAQ